LVQSVWNRTFRLVLLLCMAVLAVQLVAFPQMAHSTTVRQVSISSGSFNPNNITVNVGDSVIWINSDGLLHSVVSNLNSADSWNSGGILDGFNYTHVFNMVGSFGYYCDIHPEMTGMVVVQQPTPEFPGIVAFLTLATAIAAGLLLERGLGRRA
jgi:plastocyanin